MVAEQAVSRNGNALHAEHCVMTGRIHWAEPNAPHDTRRRQAVARPLVWRSLLNFRHDDELRRVGEAHELAHDALHGRARHVFGDEAVEVCY